MCITANRGCMKKNYSFVYYFDTSYAIELTFLFNHPAHSSLTLFLIILKVFFGLWSVFILLKCAILLVHHCAKKIKFKKKN